MAVAPFQIIAAPADVYVAPTTTAEPLVNASPPGAWVLLGKTEGGTHVKHTQKVEMLTTDQTVRPIKAIRSEEGMEISLKIAELTLENYRYALNFNAINVVTGPPHTKDIKIARGVIVQTHSLLVRGPSPYADFNLQYWVPVVVMSDEPSMDFVKDDKSTLEFTFSALNDPLQAAGLEFGHLIAQDS